MSEELQARHSTPGRHFHVSWHGGAYIEMAFGRYAQPTEVINIWNDETDEANIPFEQRALKAELVRWVEEQDKEAETWAEANDQPVHDWYAGYIENARYA